MHSKTHQTASFKKIFSGSMPPEPPPAMQIPKSGKKFLAPLPNPGDAPDKAVSQKIHWLEPFHENWVFKNNINCLTF